MKMTETRVKVALKNELGRLQQIFQTGAELKVLYHPDEIRRNRSGKSLSGEINGDFIIIYEKDQEKAISTLYYLYVEYLIKPFVQDYVDIINDLNQRLTSLLIRRKVEIVERLMKPLSKG